VASIRERIIDNRKPRDARDNINERRRRKSGDGAARGYHEHRAGATTARRIEALHPSH
jgi:hypothetical protein